jgi:hypothetical protein
LASEFKKLYAYLVCYDIIGKNKNYDIRYYEMIQKEGPLMIRCKEKDFIQEFEKQPCCKGCGGKEE